MAEASAKELLQDVRAIIFGELQAAADNGYHFDGFTASQIADDLLTYSPACEDLTLATVQPHVEAWLAERAKRREAANG